MPSVHENSHFDIAIIGGGAAGLYAAYRLLYGSRDEQDVNTQNKLNIGVFEQSQRLGGRVHSVDFKNENVIGELGAMRFRTDFLITKNLIDRVLPKEYQLEAVDFDSGAADNTQFFLRSHYYRRDDLAEHVGDDSFPYSVNEKWKGMSAPQMYAAVCAEIIEANGYDMDSLRKISPRDWDQIKQTLRYMFKGPYENHYLYEIPLWHMLLDRMDTETVTFLKDSAGYRSSFSLHSTLEVVQAILGFSLSSRYDSYPIQLKAIKGGYGTLIHALAEEVVKGGATISVGTRLESFSRLMDDTNCANASEDSDYRYELDLYSKEMNKSFKVHANAVLLCIPRRSIELLRPECILFSKKSENGCEFRELLSSVSPIASVKILLCFREPWWKERLGLNARTVTDLPLRQSYYFGATNPEMEGSLVIASYTGDTTVLYWRSLQEMGGTRAGRNGYISLGTEGHERASDIVIAEVMRQIQQIVGEDVEVPQPVDSAFADWGLDPYGGGYHCWKPGVKPWEVARVIRRPFATEKIYVAGEAFADTQQWVESAFMTAEQVVREEFGVAEPEWLKGEDGCEGYLGRYSQ